MIDIDDLTLGQLKTISSLVKNEETKQSDIFVGKSPVERRVKLGNLRYNEIISL
jgi:hypothetical protein